MTLVHASQVGYDAGIISPRMGGAGHVANHELPLFRALLSEGRGTLEPVVGWGENTHLWRLDGAGVPEHVSGHYLVRIDA